MKLYVLIAALVQAAKHDPEPDVAIAQIKLLIAEERNQMCSTCEVPA